MDDKIREELKGISKDGKVACKNALELADKLGCAPAEVGRVANELKIKVVSCSLDCF